MVLILWSDPGKRLCGGPTWVMVAIPDAPAAPSEQCCGDSEMCLLLDNLQGVMFAAILCTPSRRHLSVRRPR